MVDKWPDMPLAERRIKKPSGFQHFGLKMLGMKKSGSWRKVYIEARAKRGVECDSFDELTVYQTFTLYSLFKAINNQHFNQHFYQLKYKKK